LRSVRVCDDRCVRTYCAPVAWPNDEILLFGDANGDPYDKGFMGVGFQQHKGPVAIYDREKCVDALAEEFANNIDIYKNDEDGDPYTDAVEFFSFNTERSWVGEQTPIIISSFIVAGRRNL
jgi:hypothetical protein